MGHLQQQAETPEDTWVDQKLSPGALDATVLYQGDILEVAAAIQSLVDGTALSNLCLAYAPDCRLRGPFHQSWELRR